MKAKKYQGGGKMKQGASKRPQTRPNLSGRPTTREELMRRYREEKRERAQKGGKPKKFYK